MKRYAIVRVDSCPPRKEIDAQFVCFPKDNICSGCRYGDTKEQLIKKIETAVAIMRNKMENKEVYLDRAVATFIVEFLGVE
jgi:hypothetical protein